LYSDQNDEASAYFAFSIRWLRPKTSEKTFLARIPSQPSLTRRARQVSEKDQEARRQKQPTGWAESKLQAALSRHAAVIPVAK
jgi:hypothetical protein